MGRILLVIVLIFCVFINLHALQTNFYLGAIGLAFVLTALILNIALLFKEMKY